MFERLHTGEVSTHTSIGGAPIVYLSKRPHETFGSHVFCPECADEMCADEEDVGENDFTGHPNLENEHLECDVCGGRIEALYEDDKPDPIEAIEKCLRA